MPPIDDHPLRYKLANELHARPFPTLTAPATAVFLALRTSIDVIGGARDAEMAHLHDLLDRFGAHHPQPGATHFSCAIGRHRLKWEMHAEFVTFTVFIDRLSVRPFDPADFEVFPEDWLARAPGKRITSALIRIDAMPLAEQAHEELSNWFVPESIAVSNVLDKSCLVATDFRIDAAGHQRMALFVNEGTGQRRIGRVVQRLCEIETYKSMSMLGYFRVKAIAPQLGQLEAEVADLMGHLRSSDENPDQTLGRLLDLSGDLEKLIADTSFRFGATEAYEAIVHQRITVLREERFMGRQTMGEFMSRRYDPAMRTVASTKSRMQSLADRAGRAGQLLRTKVEVSRSAQNQALLESMDRRADLALRLQETVEGLSVVAISYYAVSLLGYLVYPLAGPLGVSKGVLTAAVTVPVVLAVWWMVRRIKARI
ncbi:DUF3422 family protein [Shimia haliotis]|uniref:Uncharacterized membrane-anchored protein n=1 Tax=Shimia haliotis TaxID=1280847 RepID=A0A1I4A1I0_9RHOB|nr:DUF3422 domain-containing protein [Shimia haliotis]SFK49639.1 Uncharacterized membrane-anchored protein [Shimia haliotis]